MEKEQQINAFVHFEFSEKFSCAPLNTRWQS